MSAKAAVDPAPQPTEQATVAAPSLPQAASAAQVPPAAEPETPPSKIVEVAPVLPAAEPKTVPARTVAVAPALPPVQPEPAPAQTVAEGTALPAAKLEPAAPQTVAAVPALPVKPETVPPASVVPPSAGVAAEVPRPLSADSMASRVLTPAPTEPPRASTAQATAPATPVPAPAPKPAPTAEAPTPAKPTSTVLASAEPGRPDASSVGGTNAAAPLADGLSVLAARVALETEMLRGSQSNPGYAACVGDQIGALTASTPASAAELAPAALAQRVFGTCAKPAPERGAAAARPAMSVTAFKAAIANAGSDGAEVLTSVLQSQVAFRLQTDKHLYRCINDGYLAKIGPAAKRPLMFRALLASLNGFSSEDYSLAGVIATSLQAFCADEQFELTVQK